VTRIVQVANFVTPTSGGLRTCLGHLAEGYAEAGHEVVQVVPGETESVQRMPWGTRVLVASTALPGTGYRVVTNVRRLERVLAALCPDRVEVHDRTTLRGLGTWASRHGVPSLVVSHERLDVWLKQWLPQRVPLRRAADRSNAALAASFDTVVCTTAWAAEEFTRLGARNLRQVPLGVDIEGFRPRLHSAQQPVLLLVVASRLSKEKRPELAVGAVRELVRRGHRLRMLVAGDGPLRAGLERQSRDLPVTWLGFVPDRGELAALLAAADVVLAPGPVETFGLAALEALACGTPVVVNRHSALPAVVGNAGRASASSAWVFADCVEELLQVDEPVRRAAARSRAETFPWRATVEGFLDVHRLACVPAVARGAA
jgi:alpha-1,6-mannosyltransferase